MGTFFFIFFFRSFLFLLLSSSVSSSSRVFPIIPFDEGYSPLFGDHNLIVHSDSQTVHLSLDESSGSGFASHDIYLHGYFSASIKLPSDYTAGVVVAFYLSNGDMYEKNHDEIDFEFLGNIRGKDWRIQTNIYGNGSTNIGREERYGLWFDPSEDVHHYSILWTDSKIIFYVDEVPIREIKRTESMGGDFPSKPMTLYSTIWDASTWATNGGKYKVNYKYAPFVAEFSDFVLHGCAVDPIEHVTNCDNSLQTSETLPSSDVTHVDRKGPINAVSSPGGLDSFLDLWDTVPAFYFDIHYIKRLELHSAAPFEVHGIAICWENSPMYYINLPRDILLSDNRKDDGFSLSACSYKQKGSSSNSKQDLMNAMNRWSRISKIIGKKSVKKFTWNLKVQIQVLKKPSVSLQRFGSVDLLDKNMNLEVVDNSYILLPPIHVKEAIDVCIVAWILWPDEESSSSPNLDKEVKKRLSPEDAGAANQCGRWRNQMRKAAHNGCCRRVAQTRALCAVLWKLLVSEKLVEVLMEIEIPLVNVLADMELWGIGVDLERCIQARKLLVKRLKQLEKEAYKLAGMTFSLNMPADIAKVLYEHLKLPIPDGKNKGKNHPSTDKHCLDALRHEHPIVPIIKEHRTLAKLLNSTLGSICSLARLSVSTQKYTLHGHWLQTSTATGRLSMEEPNLQCVEHPVDFKMIGDKNGGEVDESCRINARDFFVPTQDNWLLLTADYSQIELRLMAHFSKDSSLIELLSKPDGDVFTMIAARWIGCPEVSVGSQQREQTKKVVYGILYGMGPNSLAEQMDCTSDEAAERISNFKSTFPGVASWLREAVAFCRSKGYVETLKGRKRFLSKIKFGSSTEKSRAQRQAVNSICQGSAADIIKIAMIKIYSEIVSGVDNPESSSSGATKFHMLRDRCRILLQVHDELVLEVDPSVVKEAAILLQTSMENAVSLLVPLNVKLKIGRTWGSLEPFAPDKFKADTPMAES